MWFRGHGTAALEGALQLLGEEKKHLPHSKGPQEGSDLIPLGIRAQGVGVGRGMSWDAGRT